MAEVSQILSPIEAAAYAGVSRATVYRLCDAGSFAAKIKLSKRRVGFRRADLDAWVRACGEATGGIAV